MLSLFRKIFRHAEASKLVLPTYPETKKQTPNWSRGRIIKPTHILLHHTSGKYAGSVAWCTKTESKVSYHCIVARDGRRTILASPDQRTWHAGVSEWQGRKNCNDFMLGLAWERDTNEEPLSKEALESACEYILPILRQYNIPTFNIVRHADVAPRRKDDCSMSAAKAFRETIARYG